MLQNIRRKRKSKFAKRLDRLRRTSRHPPYPDRQRLRRCVAREQRGERACRFEETATRVRHRTQEREMEQDHPDPVPTEDAVGLYYFSLFQNIFHGVTSS